MAQAAAVSNGSVAVLQQFILFSWYLKQFLLGSQMSSEQSQETPGASGAPPASAGMLESLRAIVQEELRAALASGGPYSSGARSSPPPSPVSNGAGSKSKHARNTRTIYVIARPLGETG